METIPSLLQARLRPAFEKVVGPGAAPIVRASADTRFGDYQCDSVMALAKARRANPRQLAEEILRHVEATDVCDALEIAGAGFINFRLKTSWLAERIGRVAEDPRLGTPAPERTRCIVLDFSSPNVAKPMHIGHIRSTFLGDALARIAAFIGHKVIRDNHVGDWGTQFGMLLFGWKTQLNREALAQDPLSEMERLYKLVSARTREDAATLATVHGELVKLQNGDEENLTIWREMIRLSQRQFDEVYARLGVCFDEALGESSYSAMLKPVVAELLEAGVARESEGAICVFSDQIQPPEEDPFLIKDQDGWRPNPALVLKKDGAANYTTTDLATLQYRLNRWNPDEVVYVTDGRQQLHFRQLFTIFRRWRPAEAARVRLAHVWFGTVLGEDGKPFKTRSGETVRLTGLLDEAEERALRIVAEKNPTLDPTEQREIARCIGLGAVKYADLLPNRQSDYVFSWDRMLSFAGNTAPYLQNAAVRIQAIFRKKAEQGGGETAAGGPIVFTAPEEVLLAKRLLQFGEVLPQVLDDHRPNLLANYLFELANTFHSFYECCPVLKAEGAVRETRLLLCELSGRLLRQGLNLLGIEVPARM